VSSRRNTFLGKDVIGFNRRIIRSVSGELGGVVCVEDFEIMEGLGMGNESRKLERLEERFERVFKH